MDYWLEKEAADNLDRALETGLSSADYLTLIVIAVMRMLPSPNVFGAYTKRCDEHWSMKAFNIFFDKENQRLFKSTVEDRWEIFVYIYDYFTSKKCFDNIYMDMLRRIWIVSRSVSFCMKALHFLSPNSDAEDNIFQMLSLLIESDEIYPVREVFSTMDIDPRRKFSDYVWLSRFECQNVGLIHFARSREMLKLLISQGCDVESRCQYCRSDPEESDALTLLCIRYIKAFDKFAPDMKLLDSIGEAIAFLAQESGVDKTLALRYVGGIHRGITHGDLSDAKQKLKELLST